MPLFPGKGAHLVLNEKILGWIRDALHDVDVCYMDEAHDASPAIVIDALTDVESSENAELELSWTKQKDNFGTKAFTSHPYKKGELRVTVVLTKSNELKLDIREWYEGEQG